MRYVIARFTKEQRELTYRAYITDALKISGGLNVRWYDLFADKPKKVEMSAEEVISKIRNKFK